MSLFQRIRESLQLHAGRPRPYIDWSPFFQTWELKGKYPRIFEDPAVGAEARRLFDDARELLERIVSENLLTARGVYGFFPANSVGEDIVVYTPTIHATKERARFHGLRQQWRRKGQEVFYSLADFIAPRQASPLQPAARAPITSAPSP